MAEVITDKDASIADMDDGKKKTVGKSLSWLDDELLALSKSAAVVLVDPTVGSQMSKAEMGRRLRTQFIKSALRPSKACTDKNGGELDTRRWDGRSADACRKMWEKVRKDCQKYYGAQKKVYAAKLTGNPSPEQLDRCVQLVYLKGSEAMSHLYDCVRNPKYFMGTPFQMHSACDFLSGNTRLLDAENDNGMMRAADGTDVRRDRPDGLKKARKEKEEKKESKATVHGELSNVAGSINQLQNAMREKNEMRAAIERKRLDMERERFIWDKAEKMFGTGSCAPVEEREMAERLMRKRVLASLQEMAGESGSGGQGFVGQDSGAASRAPQVVSSDQVVEDGSVVVNGTCSSDVTVADAESMIQKNEHVKRLAGLMAAESQTRVQEEENEKEACVTDDVSGEEDN